MHSDTTEKIKKWGLYTCKVIENLNEMKKEAVSHDSNLVLWEIKSNYAFFTKLVFWWKYGLLMVLLVVENTREFNWQNK